MFPFSLRAVVPAAVVVVAMACPSPASAFDSDWSGHGELGLASTSGNTDSQTLIAKLDLSREDEANTQSLGATFQYGRSDDVESAYRYELFGNLRHQFRARRYVSGSLRHQRDHYATNEYQWALAISYGLTLIDDEDGHLRVELGPGYRLAKLQGLRIHNNEAIVRGYLDFARQLSKSTSVYNTFLVEAGRDNTYARNDLGLQVQMSETLALKAGLEVRHNTDVLPGAERTDTLTTMNLVYGF